MGLLSRLIFDFLLAYRCRPYKSIHKTGICLIRLCHKLIQIPEFLGKRFGLLHSIAAIEIHCFEWPRRSKL